MDQFGSVDEPEVAPAPSEEARYAGERTAGVIWALLYFVSIGRRADCGRTILLLVCITLIRQLGLALACGACAAVLLKGSRGTTRQALAFVVAPLAALLTFNLFLKQTHVPAFYWFQTEEVLRSMSEGFLTVGARAVRRSGQIFVYTGTFLLPVVWLLPPIPDRRGRFWLRIGALTLFAAIGGALWVFDLRMPLMDRMETRTEPPRART